MFRNIYFLYVLCRIDWIQLRDMLCPRCCSLIYTFSHRISINSTYSFQFHSWDDFYHWKWIRHLVEWIKISTCQPNMKKWKCSQAPLDRCARSTTLYGQWYNYAFTTLWRKHPLLINSFPVFLFMSLNMCCSFFTQIKRCWITEIKFCSEMWSCMSQYCWGRLHGPLILKVFNHCPCRTVVLNSTERCPAFAPWLLALDSFPS